MTCQKGFNTEIGPILWQFTITVGLNDPYKNLIPTLVGQHELGFLRLIQNYEYTLFIDIRLVIINTAIIPIA